MLREFYILETGKLEYIIYTIYGRCDNDIARVLQMDLKEYQQYIKNNCGDIYIECDPYGFSNTIFKNEEDADKVLEWIESIYYVMNPLLGKNRDYIIMVDIAKNRNKIKLIS